MPNIDGLDQVTLSAQEPQRSDGGRTVDLTSVIFASKRVLVRVWRVLTAPVRILTPSLGRAKIDRISIAPQDLRTTDPTIAADIYAGYFSFAGKVVSTGGGSPFDVVPPSRGWSETLMGFEWLRDIRAAETALARTNARTLVDDWINSSNRSKHPIAWEAPVIARRLISWIDHSPIILDGADRSFYKRFTVSITRQCARLGRLMNDPALKQHRLIGAIALTYVAVCSEGSKRLIRRASSALGHELKRYVLADGGTITRNPQDIIELLADLLPLHYSFQAQNIDAPAELINAIDRMMPMLRLFRHGDGALALFNGMSATAPDTVATLLAYQDSRSPVIENAPLAGYRRIQAAEAVVIMDAGKPPPEAFSSRAHAGCLAFEFSYGFQRMIVNCGAPVGVHDARRALARATAAHSTATLNDTSSCHFAPPDEVRWPQGSPLMSGPKNVKVSRDEDDVSARIVASHDGYRALFGVEHRRSLTLGKTGGWLIGEDQFEAVNTRRAARMPDAFALRFHLHPQIEADVSEDGQTVYLGGLETGVWTFSAGGLPLAIEESVFFAGLDGSRRTRQIVISGNFRQTPVVRWVFVRDGELLDPLEADVLPN